MLSHSLPLLVLRLLRESALTEWELLARLHTRYGINPSAREFGRLERELLGGGYVSLGSGGGLLITAPGLGLLARLEDEYRMLVGDLTLPDDGTHAIRSR